VPGSAHWASKTPAAGFGAGSVSSAQSKTVYTDTDALRADAGDPIVAVGDIEALPVEDDSFDVALSNCVLNLVPDKQQAFAEIARVLRPGGRFAISDIVRTGALPAPLRTAAELYVGCVAGAMERADYLALLRDVGFEYVTVVAETNIDLPGEMLAKYLSGEGQQQVQSERGLIQSITVTGRRPAR